MILQLAAILSRGDKLPCDDTEREPIKIIYQTAEDGLSDTIKPRLLAGNAECSQIKVIDESEAALSMLDSRVEQAIIETGAKQSYSTQYKRISVLKQILTKQIKCEVFCRSWAELQKIMAVP